MSKLFKGATSLFALVPGVTILRSGLGAPPGYGPIFGGVIEALGVLTLLLLWSSKARLKQWSWGRATRWAVGLVVSSVVLLVVYLALLNACVIMHPLYPNRTFYFPFWLGSQVARMVETAGSRYRTIERYGPDAVQAALSALTTAQSFTAAILLLVYQAIFTTLTAAFGILGFRGGKDIGD